ncbi:hypothetical protein L9F63_004330 [Diploptera punctata]|uniref:Major facilitator superfamily (MFS) profile domain-containing protein n=1 Tax=Diploptera punctata TaxID=6984 RepID=A0AAD7ZH74_DIPPU|nr:hypothetical protein L9F63_004330 [Diploptera punctata]
MLYCVAVGMSIGHSAVLLPHLQSGNSTIIIDDEMASWIASVYSCVGMLGAAFGGLAMDVWGRKTLLIVAGLLIFVGCLLITCAHNAIFILLGRIVEGLSRNMGSTAGAILIDEVSNTRARGMIFYILYSCISIGVFVMSTFGALLHWRMASGLATVLGFITFMMFCFLSESPMWLVKMNKTKSAEKALRQLWGTGREIEANEELNYMIRKLHPEDNTSLFTIKQKIIGLKNLLIKPFVLKPFLIMHFFNAIQPFCGLNVFIYYAVDMLSKTRRNEIQMFDDYYTNMIITSLRVITTIISCFLIFSVGRRKLAIASGICSFIPAFIVGFILTPNNSDLIPSYIEAYAVFILITIYTIGMTFGFFIIPALMIGETQYSKFRGFACGYIFAMNELILGGVLKIYPWLMSNLQIHGMFFMFGISCAVCTIFVYLFVPETRRLSLMEIEDYFKQSNILWINRKIK